MQTRGLHRVTFWTEDPDETGRVLEQHLGFKRTDDQGSVRRYRSAAEVGNTVMVRDLGVFRDEGTTERKNTS